MVTDACAALLAPITSSVGCRPGPLIEICIPAPKLEPEIVTVKLALLAGTEAGETALNDGQGPPETAWMTSATVEAVHWPPGVITPMV